MNTLFDIGPVLPEGFNYYPNFITEAEELLLAKLIGQFKLNNMKFHEKIPDFTFISDLTLRTMDDE